MVSIEIKIYKFQMSIEHYKNHNILIGIGGHTVECNITVSIEIWKPWIGLKRVFKKVKCIRVNFTDLIVLSNKYAIF